MLKLITQSFVSLGLAFAAQWVIALGKQLQTGQQPDWSDIWRVGPFVAVLVLVNASLQSKLYLPWNLRWHRYWYLRELRSYWGDYLTKNGCPVGWFRTAGYRQALSVTEIKVDGASEALVPYLTCVCRSLPNFPNRVLILGEPGAGKSFAAIQTTYELARRGAWRLGVRQRIPILVRLGEVRDSPLLKYIAESMAHQTQNGSGRALGACLDKLIRDDRVVFIFDAVDEIVENLRPKLMQDIRNLGLRAFRDAPLVVTGRKLDVHAQELSELGLKAYDLQDLSDEAVRYLIRVTKKPQADERKIWTRLQHSRLLDHGAIGRNPFWLRLIVPQDWEEKNRATILSQAVDELLMRELLDPKAQAKRSWQKVGPPESQAAYTRKSLAWLSYYMLEHGWWSIEAEYARMVVADALKKHTDAEKLTAHDILLLARDAQLLEYSAGVADPTSSAPVRFRNRLLQHYLAACVFHQSGMSARAAEAWAENLQWWPTFFLYDDQLMQESRFRNAAHASLVRLVLGAGTSALRIILARFLLWDFDRLVEKELDHSVKASFDALIVNDNSEQFVAAARAIVQSTPERFVGALEDSMPGYDEDRSRQVSNTLGRILQAELKEGTSVPLLQALFARWQMREIAEEVVKTVADQAVEPLLATWQTGDADLRQRLVPVLTQFRDPRVTDALVSHLPEVAEYKKIRLISALGRIGDPRALKPLMSHIDDPYIMVRETIVEAIGNMGPAAAPELLRFLDFRTMGILAQMQASKALIKIGSAAAPFLAGVTRGSNAHARREAVVVLGEIAAPESLDDVAAAIGDRDPLVRLEALKALGRFGAAALPLLVTALDVQSVDETAYHNQAVESLAAIGAASVPVLTESLGNARDKVRQGAAEALGLLAAGSPEEFLPDSPACAGLCRLLASDGVSLVRAEAAKALGYIRGKAPVNALYDALKSDTYAIVQIRILAALARHGVGAARKNLLSELDQLAEKPDDEENNSLAFVAAYALCELDDAAVIPGVEAYINRLKQRQRPRLREQAQTVDFVLGRLKERLQSTQLLHGSQSSTSPPRQAVVLPDSRAEVAPKAEE